MELSNVSIDNVREDKVIGSKIEFMVIVKTELDSLEDWPKDSIPEVEVKLKFEIRIDVDVFLVQLNEDMTIMPFVIKHV